jgi:hypothetical protein
LLTSPEFPRVRWECHGDLYAIVRMPPRFGASPSGPGAFSSSTLTLFVKDTSSGVATAGSSYTSRGSIRSFSQTPKVAGRLRITKQRRDFYEWLEGPGLNFRVPLPNSTNYLGAYDSSGTYKAGRAPKDGATTDIDGEMKGGKTGSSGDELRPFPMNKQFKSLPVLSEEYRDAIYDHVVKKGMSVRDVSVKLGVSMERVGAVVRLKEVEKQWEKEVSNLFRLNPTIIPVRAYDERKTIRLVLKTSTWFQLFTN